MARQARGRRVRAAAAASEDATTRARATPGGCRRTRHAKRSAKRSRFPPPLTDRCPKPTKPLDTTASLASAAQGPAGWELPRCWTVAGSGVRTQWRIQPHGRGGPRGDWPERAAMGRRRVHRARAAAAAAAARTAASARGRNAMARRRRRGTRRRAGDGRDARSTATAPSTVKLAASAASRVIRDGSRGRRRCSGATGSIAAECTRRSHRRSTGRGHADQVVAAVGRPAIACRRAAGRQGSPGCRSRDRGLRGKRTCRLSCVVPQK